jgi:hypothetical protein
MDIRSITSSIGAYSGAPAQTSQSPSLQQTQQSGQVKSTEKSEPQAVERKEDVPRPVVNTSGQQTGKLINVTA